jgi:hypothetical protein
MTGQIFTDGNFQGVGNDGLVASLGSLTVVVSSTGLNATTWQDSAMTITNTSPIALSSSGKAKVFLSAGTYNITLKDINGVVMWTLNDYVPISYQMIGTIAALRLTPYAGQQIVSVTGYYTAVDNIGVREYFWDALSVEADNGGTIIQVTGVVTGRWKMKVSGFINIDWFGAKGDAVTDDTNIIQTAITASAIYGISNVDFSKKTYIANGTAYVCTGININLNGCTITGSGTNNLFETGYLSGTSILSNILTGNEVNRVTKTFINGNGARITNCAIAFNLKNFNESTGIFDINFVDCITAVYARRCFYSSFHDLNSTGTASGSILGAFIISSYNNVLELNRISVNGRALAFDIIGPSSALKLLNCSAEGGAIGMKFTFNGDVGPISIDTCYFENLTDKAIYFVGDQSSENTEIVNCWFHNTVYALHAAAMKKSKWNNNKLSTTNTNYIYTNNFTTTIDIDLGTSVIAANTVPAVDSAVIGHTANNIQRMLHLRDTLGSANVYFKALDQNNGKIPLIYTGDSGTCNSNTIPFCTATKVITTSPLYNWEIQTGITYQQYSMMVAYRFSAYDEVATYVNAGIIMGSSVIEHVTGKTISISSVGGFLKITLSGYSSATQAGVILGVVRIM